MVLRQRGQKFLYLILADHDQNVVVNIIGGEVVDDWHPGDGADTVEGVLNLDAALVDFLVALAAGKNGDVKAGAMEFSGADRTIDASSHDEHA